MQIPWRPGHGLLLCLLSGVLWSQKRSESLGLYCCIEYEADGGHQLPRFCPRSAFVDDPAVTVAGQPDQRTRSLLRTVIFWLMKGGQLSWTKRGQRSCRRVDRRTFETVDLPHQSSRGDHRHNGRPSSETSRAVRGPHDVWTSSPEAGREAAGRVSILDPNAKAPAAGLHSNVVGRPFVVTSPVTVHAVQLRSPRQWLTASCDQNLRVLERHCRRTAVYTAVITFDGSLTGGGATLFRLV